MLNRKKLVIPRFTSERTEAAWWETNRAAVEADLRAVLHQSQTAPPQEVMTRGYKKKLLPVNVRLVGEDLDAARKIAEDRGIGYQAYIKLLMNQGPPKTARKPTEIK